MDPALDVGSTTYDPCWLGRLCCLGPDLSHFRIHDRCDHASDTDPAPGARREETRSLPARVSAHGAVSLSWSGAGRVSHGLGNAATTERIGSDRDRLFHRRLDRYP